MPLHRGRVLRSSPLLSAQGARPYRHRRDGQGGSGMVSLDSRTSTDRPARANVIAAASPLGPAPTTIASYECRLDINALIPYWSFLPGLSSVHPIVRQHGCIYKYTSSRFVFQYPHETFFNVEPGQASSATKYVRSWTGGIWKYLLNLEHLPNETNEKRCG